MEVNELPATYFACMYLHVLGMKISRRNCDDFIDDYIVCLGHFHHSMHIMLFNNIQKKSVGLSMTRDFGIKTNMENIVLYFT